MFLRALLAFLVLPGVVAFIMPAVLALIDPWRTGVFLPGVLVVLLGVALLLWCVRDFYGLYRHRRNPMYVGVITLVVGWSVLLTSPVLICYALLLAIIFHIRVLTHEEPWLESQFGSEWRQYRSRVGRWVPRLTPWRSGS